MEEKKKYKVTNNANDVRKFRDSFLGKDILVGPKKFILTNNPPENTNDIWKVETVEKSEKKKQTNKIKEVKKYDGSSSR